MSKANLRRAVLLSAIVAGLVVLAFAASLMAAKPTLARDAVLQAGSAVSAPAGPVNQDEEPPRRGCLACHVLVNPEVGNYTLAFEAHERTKARGREHPSVAPDGSSMNPTDQNGVETCLLCHRPASTTGTGGVGAPLALRSIVHPAHMFSVTFKDHYGGNCFTCHEVRGDGRFALLGDKVDVNEKGVPNVAPMTGLIAPSEEE